MKNDKLPRCKDWFATYDLANGERWMLNRTYHTMRYYVKRHISRNAWGDEVGYYYTIHIRRNQRKGFEKADSKTYINETKNERI